MTLKTTLNMFVTPGLAVLIALATGSSAAQAKLKSETVTYQVGESTLKGYLAYDDATSAKRPGVLIVHEWWGLNDYARKRADMLAQAGYVAFAADMFGDGKTTTHPQVAGEFAAAAMKDATAASARLAAALDQLIKNPRTDSAKTAAIGYCFGGHVVLGAALGGTEVDGVVSFHGSLPQRPVPAGSVKAKVLVLHGAADGFIPIDQVANFQKNLTDAQADWQFVSYGGAKHGFTNPDAASFGMEGLVYNPAADKRSWQAMLDFFAEIFR